LAFPYLRKAKRDGDWAIPVFHDILPNLETEPGADRSLIE